MKSNNESLKLVRQSIIDNTSNQKLRPSLKTDNLSNYNKIKNNIINTNNTNNNARNTIKSDNQRSTQNLISFSEFCGIDKNKPKLQTAKSITIGSNENDNINKIRSNTSKNVDNNQSNSNSNSKKRSSIRFSTNNNENDNIEENYYMSNKEYENSNLAKVNSINSNNSFNNIFRKNKSEINSPLNIKSKFSNVRPVPMTYKGSSIDLHNTLGVDIELINKTSMPNPSYTHRNNNLTLFYENNPFCYQNQNIKSCLKNKNKFSNQAFNINPDNNGNKVNNFNTNNNNNINYSFNNINNARNKVILTTNSSPQRNNKEESGSVNNKLGYCTASSAISNLTEDSNLRRDKHGNCIHPLYKEHKITFADDNNEKLVEIKKVKSHLKVNKVMNYETPESTSPCFEF